MSHIKKIGGLATMFHEMVLIWGLKLPFPGPDLACFGP
jgi:hypothetical protein